MIIFLFIWIASSIIISLLLARIMGRVPRMILDEVDSSENSGLYVKNTEVQQIYWDDNKISILAMLNFDRHFRNEDKMGVSQN